MMNETIFALASAHGKAGVALIRVSGPQATDSLMELTGKNPASRQAFYMVLRDPVSRETIDHGVVTVYHSPASYTGEDVVEYGLHGSPAIIDEMNKILASQPGHRMAEPGEFTKRAFENGKLDLTEAEAVADLIDAETALQKRQALSQLGGQLSDLYHDWTERLKKMLAHVEAEIEFPDEDLPVEILQTLAPDITTLNTEISAHLNDNRRGERLRDGVNVVVLGAPNAGKSSLINALAQRDIAIVSELAGTTRDVLEAHLDIGGYPVILTDTAGLRESHVNATDHDLIEQEGINRARNRAAQADLKILLFDGTALPDQDTLSHYDEKSLIVVNKLDQKIQREIFETLSDSVLFISVKETQNLEKLTDYLTTRLKATFGQQDTPSLTRQRHRDSLEKALNHLDRSLNAALPEMLAEDLRLAIRDIGRITGRVDVEDLLDVIFRDFCIGK